jgi:hypothetical protein
MQKTLPKGHTSLLSDSFRYTPAVETNVAKTFARIRAQLAMQASAPSNVRPLPARHAAESAASA